MIMSQVRTNTSRAQGAHGTGTPAAWPAAHTIAIQWAVPLLLPILCNHARSTSVNFRILSTVCGILYHNLYVIIETS
jgi:hypothetical protein